MKIYIVDDDINIVKILENIIIDKKLGTIIGHSYDGAIAYNEILEKKPDIVLVDYLMPNIDGATLTKNIRKINQDIYFIIISKISDKEMIAQSYESGVEFYINKPINMIEVQKVVRSVSEKIDMSRTISSIKGMINIDNKPLEYNKRDKKVMQIDNIKYILGNIGIFGEKGSNDIVKICSYIIQNENNSLKVDSVYSKLWSNKKVVKQRMRRAIIKGLRNIANAGIEDYMNDTFQRYSNTLYDFENVKLEMDYIRGKKSTGGKVSVSKFIENLLIQSTRV
ncbi:DNA-binding domain-containing protein [Clostridiaceae bacterium M8S5]|nr:DNA-binding domain-containing protein [Clostridiaceae bacterium M8S5]